MKKLIFMVLFVMPIMISTVYGYSDVPENHWAKEYIEKAGDKGIIQGMGNDKFGFGQQVKKGEFITMLCKMMNWNIVKSNGKWYTPYIKTAFEQGVINSEEIDAEAYITRKEMAEMLIKALGFSEIEPGSSPFQDINNQYITAAYDFGIISGKGEGIFAPDDFATREEGAAMMCRLYDKYNHKLDFIHGFYAISSWSQRETAKKMDSISFGWSRLEYDKGVVLNTTNSNGNDWNIPEGAENAMNYFSQNKIPINLAVIMNASQNGMADENACQTILLNEENRKRAVALIVNASSDFNGITIDFEGMKGADLRNGLNIFLQDLRNELPSEKVIYTAVHPVMNGEYYDAYDYETIGEISDMVILMAHDYGAVYMNEKERVSGFTTTPVTPFNQIYTALKAISEQIKDKNKIALALSVASTTCWTLDNNGSVTNEFSLHPDINTVEKRLLQQDTVVEYSVKYRNPKAVYKDDDGNKVVLWYENEQSISDKIKLAKMFGINKISVWRIGQLTDNIWEAIQKFK
ncbi:MAG: S-layer homology domain-containing protein [Clostridia bacterium]|nr:S-layer homology domain-containing protein [Clostridia bacterium]